jgi:hypothetical protein
MCASLVAKALVRLAAVCTGLLVAQDDLSSPPAPIPELFSFSSERVDAVLATLGAGLQLSTRGSKLLGPATLEGPTTEGRALGHTDTNTNTNTNTEAAAEAGQRNTCGHLVRHFWEGVAQVRRSLLSLLQTDHTHAKVTYRLAWLSRELSVLGRRAQFQQIKVQPQAHVSTDTSWSSLREEFARQGAKERAMCADDEARHALATTVVGSIPQVASVLAGEHCNSVLVALALMGRLFDRRRPQGV